MIRLSILLPLLASAATTPQSRPTPPDHHMAPPTAVDHRVMMEVERGWGPPGPETHVFTRAGDWIREDHAGQGGSSSVHSDMASGVSLSYGRDESGAVRSVIVSRHPSTGTYYRYSRERTQATDHVLGEDCTVWLTRRLGEPPGQGVNWLSCDTDDGIQLWTKAESGYDGSVVASSKATRVERRAFSQRAVRPPAEVFRFDRWAVAPRAPGAVGFEVQFQEVSPRDGPARSRTLRRRGQARLEDTRSVNGERRVMILHAAATVDYVQEAGGRPVYLSVSSPSSAQVAAWAREEPWVAVADEPDETVLGETCHWQRSSQLLADAARHECRTRDGIPLKIAEATRATWTRFVATSVSRRAPPIAAFNVPAVAADWRAWRTSPGD